jgi:hypothetical protein
MTRARRWRGRVARAAAAAAILIACDLDLKPFVEPVDAGTIAAVDSGGPAEAASPPPEAGPPDVLAEVGPPDAGAAKRVFVTSAVVSGGMGGVTGADGICQRAGQPLGGVFVAWVSQKERGALERLRGDGPWYLVDRTTKVFDSRAAIRGGPQVAIDRDEGGRRVQEGFVWTGTTSNGTTAQNCADFTTGGNGGILATGLAGLLSARETSWTEHALRACNDLAHVYCFEL